MGAKISKRYSSFKSQPKVFKLFLNVLPNGRHKTAFGVFQILVVASPGPYPPKCFEFFSLKMGGGAVTDIFRFR